MRKSRFRGLLEAALIVGVATLLAWLVGSHLELPDTVMIYLVAITLVAARLGRGPAVLASFLSVGAFDFFFVPPVLTFVVAEARHVLTFAMMFAAGLLVSGLTERIRRQEEASRQREQLTGSLLALARDLGSAYALASVARILRRHAEELLGGRVFVAVPSAGGPISAEDKGALAPAEAAVAAEVFASARAAGLEAGPGGVVSPWCLPLSAGGQVRGALGFVPRSTASALDAGRRRFLEAFAQHGSLAIERLHLQEEAEQAELKARTEELRSSLLSTFSHDLRTPLAVITGAATTLLDASGDLKPKERRDLLETVCEESDRLQRLVENILDMTRLEAGRLALKREWVPLEEIVGSALHRLEGRLGDHPVRTELAPGLPLLGVDPVLLELAVVNLVDNAVKHTSARTPIRIAACATPQAVVLSVEDRGPGLPAGSETKVFEKFYRANRGGPAGAGLGLAICRAIFEAHGGTIVAENAAEGGARFRAMLPIVPGAPPLPLEEEMEREVLP